MIFCFYKRRCSGISHIDHQINEDIKDKEVRLIGPEGEQMGIMPAREAFKIALSKDLDLVKIAPTANPPVCRIMDYGKFRFSQAKKEKEARRHQHVVEIKEVRLSPGIDVHDFNVKLRNAQKFLREGDKVKVAMRFRGREMAHASLGEQLMRQFADKCTDISSLEKPPKLEGRHMIMFLASKIQPKVQQDDLAQDIEIDKSDQ